MEEEKRIGTRAIINLRRIGLLLLQMMFRIRANTNLIGRNSLI